MKRVIECLLILWLMCLPSFSQTVYQSSNIVGYCTLSLTGGVQNLVAPPLDNGQNTISMIDSGFPNKTIIQVWNGAGYDSSVKVAGIWSSNLSIPPGNGFFIKTPTNYNLVFFGSSPTVYHALFPSNIFFLMGSSIPISSTISAGGPNTLNFSSFPDGTVLSVWNGTNFDSSVRLNGVWSTNKMGIMEPGFAMKINGKLDPNTTLGIGQGFFIRFPSWTIWSDYIQ